ncbi:MAG TPA: precorrin-6A reductase [Ruminococcus sp.]|nr:precorrin-6A reductase [Ruminococcus sp.]HCR74771.1 precorrin-6A reductase [Ruminococcus sp.]
MSDFKNIAVIAGTSESAVFIEAFQNKYSITAFAATELGRDMLEGLDCRIHTGRLDYDGFLKILPKFDCVVDMSHPFAVEVTRTVRKVCDAENIPYFRAGREKQNYSYKRIITAADKFRAADYLNSCPESRILFTTGVNTLLFYAENIIDFRKRAFVRIINTPESLNRCCGYMDNIIIGMPPFTSDDTYNLIKKYDIDILVSKDSGKRGGVLEKINAAEKADIPVILIESPEDRMNLMSIEELFNEF